MADISSVPSRRDHLAVVGERIDSFEAVVGVVGKFGEGDEVSLRLNGCVESTSGDLLDGVRLISGGGCIG